jgi:hypothetical protein
MMSRCPLPKTTQRHHSRLSSIIIEAVVLRVLLQFACRMCRLGVVCEDGQLSAAITLPLKE